MYYLLKKKIPKNKRNYTFTSAIPHYQIHQISQLQISQLLYKYHYNP